MINPEVRKRFLKTLSFGILSGLSYALFFVYRDGIMDYCTRGSAYAVLPILAALYFSVVHGFFASNLLALLGMEAAGRKRGAG